MTGEKCLQRPTMCGNTTGYWRCAGRTSGKAICPIRCKGTYFLNNLAVAPTYEYYIGTEQTWPSAPPSTAHNHPPPPSVPLSRATTAAIHTAAQHPRATPNRIWSDMLAQDRLHGNVTNGSTTPSLSQVRSVLCDVRTREFEAVELPSRLREIGVDFEMSIEHSSVESSRFMSFSPLQRRATCWLATAVRLPSLTAHSRKSSQ